MTTANTTTATSSPPVTAAVANRRKRLLALLRTLDDGLTMTAGGIGKQLKTSGLSVCADIAALRGAGYAIETVPCGPWTGYRLAGKGRI